ncbi:MAG: hypothetical protein QG570_89 [Patescibacteria group bacterium]|nr:hypothetical protein [Patescibacteria group bacterium]
MIDYLEAPATIPQEEVKKVLRENVFVDQLHSFVAQTQEELLIAHTHIGRQFIGTNGFLTDGQDCTQYNGWRISPRETELDPLGGTEILKTITGSEGNETDFLYTPILSSGLYSTELGQFAHTIIGGHYSINEGFNKIKDERSISFRYLIDERNPNVVDIRVNFHNYGTPYLSFRIKINRVTKALLEYEAREFDYGAVKPEPSVMQLIEVFSEFREMWLQTKDFDTHLESF